MEWLSIVKLSQGWFTFEKLVNDNDKFYALFGASWTWSFSVAPQQSRGGYANRANRIYSADDAMYCAGGKSIPFIIRENVENRFFSSLSRTLCFLMEFWLKLVDKTLFMFHFPSRF